jgi:serine/threonine protein kinase
LKTTYNGTYTQVDELESLEGILILKQRLKDNAMQDSFVRSNFLSGARFLQSLKDSSLLTIEEVIETSEEVSIVCENDGFQQLGVYLETQSQLSDAFILELIQKMLRCLDYLHQNSLFHQGLNPNSFVVNKQGEVKLTLFGTLEHRLYHLLPAIGDENPSIQNAMCFYSPERKVNYGAINLASENYSFGLIIWYLKCVQLKLTNTTDLVLNFPEYSSTGSVWDNVIEACLQEDPKKRPESTTEIAGFLPKVDFPKLFIIRNFDRSRYRVTVNQQEQPTSYITGSELKVAISTEFVVVEIIDKQTNSVVQTHDTRLSKTHVMSIKGGSILTNGIPLTGSSIIGGNLGGSTNREPHKPKMRSKKVILIILSCLLLLVGVGISAWKFGWFGGEDVKTLIGRASSDNASTKNEIANISKVVKPKVGIALPSEPKPITPPSPKSPDPTPPISESLEISAFKPVLYWNGLSEGARANKAGGLLRCSFSNNVPKKYQKNGFIIVSYKIVLPGLKTSLEGSGSYISPAHLNILKSMPSGKCSISVRYTGSAQGIVTAMFYL